MKSWELANSVLRNFFPALRPGLSLVHHQDFVHFFTPWIHLIMYRLREYFEPYAYVREGSYIFRYRKEILPSFSRDLIASLISRPKRPERHSIIR